MNNKFKYDLHVHTKEGSKDATLSILDTLKILEEKEYDGVLITDHNSYKGYKYYLNNIKDTPSISVIKGIEYDTIDAGHMLVIMPNNVDLKILEYRGLTLRQLIGIVHSHGGIIGAAHPYYDANLGIAKSFKYKDHLDILKSLDFIETFNASEPDKHNKDSIDLAEKYNLPMTGGSDSHNYRNAGKGYTLFDNKINSEDELIAYIKNKKETEASGELYSFTFKHKLGPFGIILFPLYWIWNRILWLIYLPIRQSYLKRL